MNEPQFDKKLAIPRSAWLGGLLWAAPVEPGLYGDGYLEGVLITTNHKSSVARFCSAAEENPIGILAIDASGLSPKAAVAFDLIKEQDVQRALDLLPDSMRRDIGRVLIPLSLTMALGSQNLLKDFPVQTIPDHLDLLGEYISDPALNTTPNKTTQMQAITQRLLAGFRLWMGQVLVFTIPLLIFGWHSLFWGTICLLLGTIAVSLFWRILPHTGSFRGFVAGFILALILGSTLFLAGSADWRTIIRYSLSIWIDTAWMGIVLTGVRQK